MGKGFLFFIESQKEPVLSTYPSHVFPSHLLQQNYEYLEFHLYPATNRIFVR